MASGPEHPGTRRASGRFAAAAALAASIPATWWIAAEVSSGGQVLGFYSRAALGLALAASVLLLWGVYAVLGGASLREKALHGLLAVGSVLSCFVLLELPAYAGWIDYGKIVSPPDSVIFTRVRPWHRPTSQYDPELLFIHRPRLEFRGEAPGDLVAWLGIATARRYPVDVRYDANGFRNERDLEAAAIVALGDSFVEAGLVAREELLTTRLAQRFGVDVANLGQGGYAPQQELVVLRRYGMPLRPRVVLWFFFEGNDLLDVHRFVQFQQDPSRGVRQNRTFSDRSLVRNVLQTLEWMSMPRLEEDAPEAVRRSCRLRGRDETLYFAYPGEPLSAADVAALEVLQSSVLEARRLAAEGGARLLFVYVPTKFRVYRDECEFPPDGYGRTWQPHDLPARLEAWTGANDIPWLDLTPRLQAAAAGPELVYFADDGHWNGEANRIAADAIAERIEQEGWVDALR